jgi:hypothetical protein
MVLGGGGDDVNSKHSNQVTLNSVIQNDTCLSAYLPLSMEGFCTAGRPCDLCRHYTVRETGNTVSFIKPVHVYLGSRKALVQGNITGH